MSQRLALAITEAQLQSKVIKLAKLRGWRVHHGRPARSSSGGWSTPITGDVGFPDLVLARGGRVLLVELKSEAGRLSPDQRHWAAELAGLWRCWRPSDFADGTILAELS